MSDIKIVKPEVYVVGRQVVDDTELSRFLGDMDVTWESDSEVGAEVLTETAGRVCYLSFAKPRPGGNAAYLQHLKEAGHGSCLEHAVWNLLITGVSRSLTHELVRHRAGFGFSQLSQRYVDESVAEYVCPPDLAGEVEAYRWHLGWMSRDWPRMSEPEQQRLVSEYAAARAAHPVYGAMSHKEFAAYRNAGCAWLESVRGAQLGYESLSEYLAGKAARCGLEKTEARKFARQAARSVLPNATETKIFVTVNARAARHFVEMRGSRHADPEIRKLAGLILDALQKDSPNLFGDYRRVPLPDGTQELVTDYRKV